MAPATVAARDPTAEEAATPTALDAAAEAAAAAAAGVLEPGSTKGGRKRTGDPSACLLPPGHGGISRSGISNVSDSDGESVDAELLEAIAHGCSQDAVDAARRRGRAVAV